ncbi:MAG: TonB-dependent receptor plug domain-containing protein, partial [bacterium]
MLRTMGKLSPFSLAESKVTSLVALLLIVPCLSMPTALFAQSEDDEEINKPQSLQDVVVSATRSEKSQKQLPESVTVLTKEDIEDEMAISGDLGEVIGKHVPGVGPANQSMSNFAQTLRGRDFLTLIDGVPQTTPMRDGARDLHNIDPSSVKRIEIIR